MAPQSFNAGLGSYYVGNSYGGSQADIDLGKLLPTSRQNAFYSQMRANSNLFSNWDFGSAAQIA